MQQDQLNRQARAQALLFAHARSVRSAATVTALLRETCALPLGGDWRGMAIMVVDAERARAEGGLIASVDAPEPGEALRLLMARAAAAAPGAGWLRSEDAGTSSFAMPIGSPPWAVMGIAASVPQPAEEDLTALATIAADLDQARAFLVTREQVEYRATHNPVTGLPNRATFERELALRIAQGPQLVALLDVHRFRQFNDSRSRRYGDRLLGEIGARLRRVFPADALISHPQADDFLIAFPFAEPLAAAPARLTMLVEQLCAEPFLVEGDAVSVEMHAGVLVAPAQGDTAEEIERSLSAVRFEARDRGSVVLAVSEESRAQAPLRADLERELRGAFVRREFELFLQPKFDAMNRSITGAEALIRWRHPSRGLVSPAMFIPLLEHSGMIIEVGAWVRSEGLAIWQRWRELGFGQLRIAVNVSSRELRHAGFVAGCESLLAPLAGDHGLDVEITESMLMADIGRSVLVLQSLRDLGCKIAIDDFGTGYSSLNYLSRLPADTLKVDQSFTAALVSSAETLSMVTNIIGLAHSLGLSVVAEGVEQDDQADLLRLLRCDEMQGYLFGKPVPVAEFERNFLAAPVADASAVPKRMPLRRDAAAAPAPPATAAVPARPASRAPAARVLAVIAAVLLMALALGWWWRTQATPAAAVATRAANAPAPAPIGSIAVLPFADASRGQNNQHLAEGLSEELIDRLTRIPQLRVIARGSAFSFADRQDDAGAVARGLGVASVLSGRLRRDADEFDLSVQLRAPDGAILWSHRYQRPMSDLLLVEDELVRAVVAALRLELMPAQEQLLAARTTTNPEAFNQYLLGRKFYRRSTPEGFQLAKSALEISTALDPGFAPAYAELAITTSYLADTAATADEVAAGQARARELADKAVALDPQSAAGYRVRASLRGLDFDFEGAMRDTVQALRLNGGDSDNQRHYALLLASQGRLDEALLAATRAAELDPLSTNAYLVIGVIHNAQANFDAAIGALEKSLELTPGHGFALGNLVQSRVLKGDGAGALAVARTMQPGMWRTFALVLAHHAAGEDAAADAALAELVRTSADAGAYQIAEAYAWRGDADAAFFWLERAYRQHDGGLELIKIDPLLASLRSDERYAQLVARLKLPD